MRRFAVGLAVACAVGSALLGCDSPEGRKSAPRKQGAHVRVVNATDGTLAFVLYPKQLNDRNAPGEANPFQKEPPGPRNLQILSPDRKLLQEIPVTLESGTPTTFVVLGGPRRFDVQKLENEERFAPEGKCRVTLASAYEGPPMNVALGGPGGMLELGSVAKIGLGGSKVVPPGTYRVRIGDVFASGRLLEPGISYSVVVRRFKGKPTASILRNSPPEMRVVGVEGASAAG